MDNAILDKKILEILESGHGASTRHLANSILEERFAAGTTTPGKDKMYRVYARLVKMRKSGRIISSSPGYWRIKRNVTP